MKHIRQFENFIMNEMVGDEYNAIIDLLNNDEWLMIGKDNIKFKNSEVTIDNFEVDTKYGRRPVFNGCRIVITPDSVEKFIKDGSYTCKNLMVAPVNGPWRTIQRKKKMIEGGQVDIYKPENKSKFKRYFD